MKIKEVLLEMYTAYVLDEQSRWYLTQVFPPKYSNVIGHHVTVNFGVPATTEAPSPAVIQVVGYADSGDGIEALVVSVNGRTERPDGSTYHITWSIDPVSGYKPKDSNALVRQNWKPRAIPIPIETTPAVLK